MAKQNGPAVKAKPFFTGYIKLTALSCSRFVSGIQWAYKFIVMLISECPIISCSVLGGIPLSMHLVTNVSRNAWTVNFSIPAASQILLISSFTMDDFRIFPRGLLNIVSVRFSSFPNSCSVINLCCSMALLASSVIGISLLPAAVFVSSPIL